ncbi:hypothetical protein [Streptomyces sp. NPDC056401]|uniref:hypothetical protein n=1 Tax=Streptomyces sp. NPDC056401 TaxID=3345809 RepID=UPI0035E0DE26
MLGPDPHDGPVGTGPGTGVGAPASYAHAPVPVHLLVDRFDEHGPTATLFTEPENGACKHAVRVAFGGELGLPAPFAVAVDTGSFPR